ncbi:MAG: hypothetical protein NVS4B3_09880 [Gemmatimonadaceae bacterium]
MITESYGLRRTLVGVSLALSLATPGFGQHRGPPGYPRGWPEFVQILDTSADSDRVVGASGLIMRDGRVLAHHEHGFADRTTGRRVDTRTIFHFGSITKTLTAIAIMQLRDRGRLSLEDRVTRFVPELRRIHDPYSMIDSITIRMLLSHSAGFQNPTWPYRGGKAWEPFEPTTWEQLVAMMPYQELHFRPGSRYGYSNPGFIYLARIIEQLSGDAWAVYVQKNIFAPLGLTRSYFGVTPYYLADDRSANYTLVRDSVRGTSIIANGLDFDPGITIPNGGWNAPLDDVATYLAFLTGATHGDSALQRRFDVVLKRQSLEEMWRPGLRTGDNRPGDSIGLSFFVVGEGRAQVVGHTGSQAGFIALLYFNPRTTEAVAVTFNTATDGADPLRSGFERVRNAAIALLQR